MRVGFALLISLVTLGSGCNLFLVPCDDDLQCTRDEACGSSGFCEPLANVEDAGANRPADAGTDAGPTTDAGSATDAGSVLDGGAGADAGGSDAGRAADGGAAADAGDLDGGGGTADGGGVTTDAGACPANLLPPDWWDACWGSRARYRLHHVHAEQDLVQFPVEVFLYAADFGGALPSLTALRFVDDDGQVMPYEVTGWFPDSKASLFVRAPGAKAGRDDAGFWLYWDNPEAGAPDGDNPAAVWANGYEAVLHLDELGVGTFSASLGNHPALGLGSPPGTTTGASGNGLVIGANTTLHPDDLDNHFAADGTLEVWIKEDILSQGPSSQLMGDGVPDSVHIYAAADTNRSIAVNFVGASTTGDVTLVQSLNDTSQWQHIGVSWGGSPARAGLLTNGTGYTTQITTVDWTANEQSAVLFDGFAGAVDEVRFSTVRRSTDWLEASYRSLRQRVVIAGDVPLAPSEIALGTGEGRAGDALVEWTFDDPPGSTVVSADVADGVMANMDLSGVDPDKATFSDGALHIEEGLRLTTDQVEELMDTCNAGDGLTVEAWVMPTSPYGGRVYNGAPVVHMLHPVQGGVRSFGIEASPTAPGPSRWHFPYRTKSGTGRTPAATQRLSADGEVHQLVQVIHLDAMAGTATMTAYLDGNPAGSDSSNSGWQIGSGHTLAVAGPTTSRREFFTGSIYYVGIWCRPLSLLEIAGNLASGPL
jgi:hypothetical protein